MTRRPHPVLVVALALLAATLLGLVIHARAQRAEIAATRATIATARWSYGLLCGRVASSLADPYAPAFLGVLRVGERCSVHETTYDRRAAEYEFLSRDRGAMARRVTRSIRSGLFPAERAYSQ